MTKIEIPAGKEYRILISKEGTEVVVIYKNDCSESNTFHNPSINFYGRFGFHTPSEF